MVNRFQIFFAIAVLFLCCPDYTEAQTFESSQWKGAWAIRPDQILQPAIPGTTLRLYPTVYDDGAQGFIAVVNVGIRTILGNIEYNPNYVFTVVETGQVLQQRSQTYIGQMIPVNNQATAHIIEIVIDPNTPPGRYSFTWVITNMPITDTYAHQCFGGCIFYVFPSSYSSQLSYIRQDSAFQMTIYGQLTQLQTSIAYNLTLDVLNPDYMQYIDSDLSNYFQKNYSFPYYQSNWGAFDPENSVQPVAIFNQDLPAISSITLGDIDCVTQSSFIPGTITSYESITCSFDDERSPSVLDLTVHHTDGSQSMNFFTHKRFDGTTFDVVLPPQIFEIPEEISETPFSVLQIEGSNLVGQKEISVAGRSCNKIVHDANQPGSFLECEIPDETPSLEIDSNFGYLGGAGVTLHIYDDQVADVDQSIETFLATAGTPDSRATVMNFESPSVSFDSDNDFVEHYKSVIQATTDGDHTFILQAQGAARIEVRAVGSTNVLASGSKQLDLTVVSWEPFSGLKISATLTEGEYYQIEVLHNSKTDNVLNVADQIFTYPLQVGIQIPGLDDFGSYVEFEVWTELENVANPFSAYQIFSYALGLNGLPFPSWMVIYADDLDMHGLSFAEITWYETVESLNNKIHHLHLDGFIESGRCYPHEGEDPYTTPNVTGSMKGRSGWCEFEAYSCTFKPKFSDYIEIFAYNHPHYELNITTYGVQGNGGRLFTDPELNGEFEIVIAGTPITIDYMEDPLFFKYKILDAFGLGVSDVEVAYKEGIKRCGGLGNHWVVRLANTGSFSLTVGSTSNFNGNVFTSISSSQPIPIVPISYFDLRTIHSNPTIFMTVDGFLSFCPNDNCDGPSDSSGVNIIVTNIARENSTSSKLLFTVDTNGQTLNADNFFDALIGGVKAVVESFDGTILVVNLDHEEGSGSSGRILEGDLDYLPIPGGIHRAFIRLRSSPTSPTTAYPVECDETITVDINIQSVSPTESGPGVTTVTILGDGFGLSLDEDYDTAVYVGDVLCTITELGHLEITADCDLRSTQIGDVLDVVVSVSGQNQTATDQITIAVTPIITSFTPSSTSPTVPTEFVINGQDFGTDFEAVSIKLIPQEGQSKQIPCNICPNGLSDTQITCMINGGEPGAYTLQAQLYGKPFIFDGVSADVELSLKVLSISPNVGSNAGGTLLTITGDHFSSTLEHNQVTIGVRNVICDIEDYDTTFIKCRTRANTVGYAEPQDIHVLSRVSFEADCVAGDCTFEYQAAQTPEIQSVVKQADGSYRVQGDKFVDGSTTVHFRGEEIVPLSVQAPNVVNFELPAGTEGGDGDFQVYVDGLGFSSFFNEDDATLNIPHTISSVSPLNGAASGTFVTITGESLSTEATVTFGNGERCTVSAELSSSTQIVCTATGSASGDVIVTQSGVDVSAGVDYQVTLDFSVSNVAPTTLAGSGILTFTLDDATSVNTFVVSLFNLISSYESTSTTQNGNSFDVTFNDVGYGIYSISIIINGEHILNIDQEIQGENEVTLPVTPLETSILGGATIAVDGSGFSSNIPVTVCGLNAEVDSDASDATHLEFTVPAFNNINLQQSAVYAEADTLFPRLWESDVYGTTDYAPFPSNTYYSENPNCFIQADFGADVLATLNGVNVLTSVATSSLFDGASIQGSADGINWDNIPDFAFDGKLKNGIAQFEAANNDISQWPSYRYYRFTSGSSSSNCRVVSIEFVGILLSSNTATDNVVCDVTIGSETLSSIVTYRQSLMATVNSVSPSSGTSAGGTAITISGSGFGTNAADVSVLIDGNECSIDTITDSEIVCTSPAAPDVSVRNIQGSKIVVSVNDNIASNENAKFRYIERWSERSTWGCGNYPQDGWLVHIPKGMTLLVDDPSIEDDTFGSIVVEGALIIDGSMDITLNTNNIMVQHGSLEIGTEENPITNHEVTINLAGGPREKGLPLFGSKVIANNGGDIRIHGAARQTTWTTLSQTFAANENVLHLTDAVDWQPEEQIVVTSTAYGHSQTEVFTILAVDANQKDITVASNAAYDHFSGAHTDGAINIDLRAEVGLLSRNVKITANDEYTFQQKHGARLQSNGLSSPNAVFEVKNVEFVNVGQAFKRNGASIKLENYHAQSQTVFSGNSIHNTYSRGLQLENVDDLTIQNNVLQSISGTAVYTDPFSNNLVIEDNLVAQVNSIDYLYNIDKTPSGFYIQNPNAELRRNVVAGSQGNGFYYNMQGNQGSACPQGQALGAFEDNEAHAIGNDALTIWSYYAPRQNACSGFGDSNLAVIATFSGFTAWKVGDDAVRANKLGGVVFYGFNILDTKSSGFEIEQADESPNDVTTIQNSVIIGVSVIGDVNDNNNFHGIQTVYTNDQVIDGVEFRSFSGSQLPILADSSVIFVVTRNLSFDPLITTRVKWSHPRKTIFKDEDGTLVGIADSTYVTYRYAHLEVPECTQYTSYENKFENGIICNEDVDLRGIRFDKPQVREDFYAKDMLIQKVAPGTYDGDGDFSALAQHGNGAYSWEAAFVAGYRYFIKFELDLDFAELRVTQFGTYQSDDAPIEFIFIHDEDREHIQLFNGDHNITQQANLWADLNSITGLATGDWFYDSTNKYIHFAVNTRSPDSITIEAYKCYWSCPPPPEEDPNELSQCSYYWSVNPPVEVDGVVTVNAGEKACFDECSVTFNELHINGQMVLDLNSVDKTCDSYTISAKKIWVSGMLRIGASTSEMTKDVTINLIGYEDDEKLVVNRQTDAHAGAIVVQGRLYIYGKSVTAPITRLYETAAAGSSAITIAVDPDNFDSTDFDGEPTILLTSSSFDGSETEEITVDSIDYLDEDELAVLHLKTPLQHTHYGASQAVTVLGGQTLDMRSQLAHISRNIKIQSSTDSDYGASLIVTQFFHPVTPLVGMAIVKDVEFSNMGKRQTTQGAVRFQYMQPAERTSIFVNNVIRDSNTYGLVISNAQMVSASNNVILNSVQSGVYVSGANTDIAFNDNIIASVTLYGSIQDSEYLDGLGANFYQTGTLTNSDISGNVALGCSQVCYTYRTSNNDQISNNAAHSGKIGWLAYNDEEVNTIQNLIAYNVEDGVISYWRNSRIEASGLILAENLRGATLNLGREGDDQTVEITNSYFAGISRGDCTECYAECPSFHGIVVPVATVSAKNIAPYHWELPWVNPLSDSVFHARTTVSNSEFVNFEDNIVAGCTGNSIFKTNEYASDYFPLVDFNNNNVSPQASNFAVFDSPNQDEIDLCGGDLCTGLNNVVIIDNDPTSPVSHISNNPAAAAIDSSCNITSGNGFACSNNRWGHLLLRSLDDDRETRFVDPVTIETADGTSFYNSLNAQKNRYNVHIDDDVNTNNQLASFNSLIFTDYSLGYDIRFQSTPPRNIEIKLDSLGDNQYVIARIHFVTNENIAVYNNGERVNPLALDPDHTVVIGETDECGTNIYHYAEQYIEVMVRNGDDCNLAIGLTSTILASVRYEMTPTEFYALGGNTLFVDRVASVLGIKPWEIAVVEVYQGSTVVVFQIHNDIDNVYRRMTQADPSELSIGGKTVLGFEFYMMDSESSKNAIKFFDEGGKVDDKDGQDDKNNDDGVVESTLPTSGVDAKFIGICVGVLLVVIIIVAVIYKAKKSKAKKVLTVAPYTNKPSKSESQIPAHIPQRKKKERTDSKEELIPEPLTTPGHLLPATIEGEKLSLEGLGFDDEELNTPQKKINIMAKDLEIEKNNSRRGSVFQDYDLFPRKGSLFQADNNSPNNRRGSVNSSGIIDTQNNSQHLFFDYNPAPKKKSLFTDKPRSSFVNYMNRGADSNNSSESPKSSNILLNSLRSSGDDSDIRESKPSYNFQSEKATQFKKLKSTESGVDTIELDTENKPNDE